MGTKDDKTSEAWVNSLMNQLKLAFAQVDEAGIGMFLESFAKDPEKTIDTFPEHLERILGLAGGPFQGTGCGGPYPPVVIPLWNAIGSAYPEMPKK